MDGFFWSLHVDSVTVFLNPSALPVECLHTFLHEDTLPSIRTGHYPRNPVLITPYNAKVSDALSIPQRSPAPREICPLIPTRVDLALFRYLCNPPAAVIRLKPLFTYI